MKVDTFFKDMLFTTVLIQARGPRGVSTGTGFITEAADNPDNHIPVLVTNWHVIAGAEEGVLRFVRARNGEPVLGSPIGLMPDDFPAIWQPHPDPTVDVAAAFIGPFQTQAKEQGDSLFIRRIGLEAFPNEDLIADMDAVEDVFFVGYPRGLYDTVNDTPIVRRGITATPIELDWRGAPTFLIDGSVFRGSSGSPVFVHQRGEIRQDGVDVAIRGHRSFLAGILASVYQQPATGRIVPAADRAQVRFDRLMDLGIVYKASAIRETIDHLMKVRNIDPATGVPGD